MSWIIGLKFFHYLALFLAGGLGVGNAVIAKAHMKAGQPPAPPVQAGMMTLARLGLVALVVLWATGLALVPLVYGSFDLGWAFHMKLLGATVLLITVTALNIHLATSARQGTPPNPKFMAMVPILARSSLVLVLLGVAIITTGA